MSGATAWGYSVKNLLERHAGRLWAESKEGKGCTVHFTLPATLL